mmetsp:Transcript_32749/g.92896  ORF Transcript_32749/g.92896 Transcript_32749/m.92896 type:complete len:411 (-) Transcript_32749:182-1414(-)
MPGESQDAFANVALQALQGSPMFLRELIAGGVAGGIAKTSVAPLERTKILFQTGRIRPGSGVWRTLVDIASSEGWQGLFKGNTATVTRIIPYSAIHFWAYEHFRRILVAETVSRRLPQGPWMDLLAGSAAGATSVVLTYPLDLVRTRMAWQLEEPPRSRIAGGGSRAPRSFAEPVPSAPSSSSSPTGSRSQAPSPATPNPAAGSSTEQPALRHRRASTGPRLAAPARPPGGPSCPAPQIHGEAVTSTMLGMARNVLRGEGLMGLYSGIGPTLWGILPYAGIKFYVYQSLKQQYRHLAVQSPSEDVSPRLPLTLMLSFGAVSGLVGQTLTYPLDIVRRRMQVQGVVINGVPAGGAIYSSTLDCMVGMVRNEGLRSLFYGLHINYIKVIPSTALGFMIYDYMKSLLRLPNHL